jgi:hypothetical protein
MENENQTSRGHVQDHAKVAGAQQHDVNYQKEKMSSEEDKKAVKPEDKSRQKLERRLRNRPLL